MQNVCSDISAPTIEFKAESGRMSWAWFVPSGHEQVSRCVHPAVVWVSKPSSLPLTDEWHTRDVWCEPGRAPLRYSHTGRAPLGL